MTKTTSHRASAPKAKSVIDPAATLARAELMIDYSVLSAGALLGIERRHWFL